MCPSALALCYFRSIVLSIDSIWVLFTGKGVCVICTVAKQPLNVDAIVQTTLFIIIASAIACVF